MDRSSDNVEGSGSRSDGADSRPDAVCPATYTLIEHPTIERRSMVDSSQPHHNFANPKSTRSLCRASGALTS
jgi:hypothetical protein